MMPFPIKTETAPDATQPVGTMPWDRLLMCCAALFFIAAALRFFNYAEDDVFIPMRYALNFWRGYGWVMNPGEHVEGYTSPLHLWYLTILLRFLSPDHALAFSKFLGIALGLAILQQTRRLAQQIFPSPVWIGGVSALFVAVCPEFALAMVNGLETGFATLLLTAGTVRFIAECRGERQDHRISALLFLGAALARPELTASFPLLLLLETRFRVRRQDLVSLALYALPLCSLLIFRWTFYGDVLPNTFYAKRLPVPMGLELGWSYIQAFVFPNFAYAILGGIGLICVLRSRGAGARVLPALLSLHALFLLRSGGDWMRDNRFLVVVLPLLATICVGTAWAFFRTWAAPREHRRQAFTRVALIALSCLLVWPITADVSTDLQSLSTFPGLSGIAETLAPHPALGAWMIGNTDGRLAVGHWIASHACPGQTVLYSEMGVATLQNPDVRFLDIRGLTDRRIARMPEYYRDRGGVQGEHWWQDADKPLGRYILQRHPEWVVLLWDVYSPGNARLDRSTALYVPSGCFHVQIGGRQLTVATWRRRDVTPRPPDATADAGAARRSSLGADGVLAWTGVRAALRASRTAVINHTDDGAVACLP
jgi:arabinofuranosyltransferase